MASVHQTAPQSNLVQINCDFGEVRRFDCALSYSGSECCGHSDTFSEPERGLAVVC